MRIPFSKIADTTKLGVETIRQSDEPVRVSVFVDSTATPFLIETVRDAFVPQTTSAIVRVARLDDIEAAIKRDTDVAIVLSCGSAALQEAVQQVVVAGAPTVVLAESSVEVPFIESDTRMLGLIASTEKVNLLESLARWILDRTEKETAFASNFPFMRIAAANRVITQSTFANLATGALVFIPGADYPVMAAAQVGMAIELASIFGKPMRLERGYEIAGVLGTGLVLRSLTRVACKGAGKWSFAVKALVAAGGTFAMGRALCALYERDVDYSRANDAVASAASLAREAVSKVSQATDTIRSAA